MNNILIVVIVIMMICIVVNFIGLFYKINKIEEIEIKLKKLEENFEIIKQNYYNVLLKIHGDDGK